MISGIILAAGESTRIGRPKALLRIKNNTFLEHIIALLQESKVGSIKVILGHDAKAIIGTTHLQDVETIVNSEYKKGQLSSLKAGISRLAEEANVDGAMICLVDHPLVSINSIDRLIDAFYKTKKSIILPTYKGKRGHPVLFSRALFGELLNAPLEEGARAVLKNHGDKILEVETDDEGILMDIDTLEEYTKIQATFC